MPFDLMPRETPADRRARLITALRQQIPSDFVWDFSTWSRPHECGTVGCACGLALHLGITKSAKMDAIATAIGITNADAKRIFTLGNPITALWTYGTLSYNKITPTMVARALERCRGIEQ